MSTQYESLEPRRLLSASLDPATKLLTVTGTNAKDVIRVAIAGVNLQVTIGGRVSTFPLKKVGSILIDALGGNDDVDIKNEIKLPSTIYGGSGNDSLGGGGGNDDIDGGAGADVIAGGPGIDTADYSSRTASIIAGIGGMADDGEAGEHDNIQFDVEQIAGGSGNDQLTGSGLNNTLIGNGGNDLLIGAGGNDSLEGDAGDDTLRGGTGDDIFSGGDGSDWVDYSDHDAQAQAPGVIVSINIDDTADSGIQKNFVQTEYDNIYSDVENVIGSAGPDYVLALGETDNIILGRGGDDFIQSLDGNDTVDAGLGNDSIFGGMGADLLTGGPDSIAAGQSDSDYIQGDEGNNTMNGGAGDDSLNGFTGDDVASGGDGNDRIDGEVGADSLSGNAGDDTITGGVGDDTLDGGDGVDSLSGDDDNDLITDNGTIVPDDTDSSDGNLSPQDAYSDEVAIDTLDGGGGNDTVNGGDGQAFIFGGDGNDTLNGGAGDEAINGGLGDDSVDAGAGNDSIIGDFGLDTLNGDAGNDIFVNADGQSDTIDGGDDLDFVQFEPAGTESLTNIEGTYDQPDDETYPAPALAKPDVQPAFAPAGALPYSVSKGVLNISGELDGTGAAIDDNISLSQSGSTISLIENGSTYAISATGLKGIFIDAGSGDDFVALATSTGKSTINLSSTISGGRGDDVLRGGNGIDSIVGGLGNDALAGNAGDDVLNGGSDVAGQDADGRDTIMGGAGLSDTVRYDSRTTPLFLSLDGVANDGAAGEGDLIGADVENVFGGRGNDSIVGNAAANLLSGGTGADTIRGGAGSDKLIGTCVGDSSDTLYGDAGIDLFQMIGDKKADRYNVGPGESESIAFVSKDPAPGGGFLDLPI